MAAYAYWTVNGYYALTKGLTIGQAISRGYLSFTGDGLGVGGQGCTQFFSGYLNTDIPADAVENSAECPQVWTGGRLTCIQFHEKWKEPTVDGFTIPATINGHQVKYSYLTVQPLYENDHIWNEINVQNCGPTTRDVLGNILCLRFRDENDELHFSPVLNNIYDFNFVSRQKLVSLNPDVRVYDPDYGWGPQRIYYNSNKVCDLCLGGWTMYDPIEEEYFGTPYTSTIININGLRFYEDYREGDPWLMSLTPTSSDEMQISNALSKVFVMGPDVIEKIAHRILFNDDPNVISAVLDGLQLYGQNPADCIIDLYCIPFDPTAGSPTAKFAYGHSNSHLTIGNYGPTYVGSHVEVTHIKTYSLGSMDFSLALGTYPIYNDWRDYVSYNMYIYLPYAGIYHLDVPKYMHRTLSLKAMFDIRTGQLKYYIFADNNVMDMMEGSVRMNVPISSSDKVAAANLAKSSIAEIGAGVGAIASSITKVPMPVFGGAADSMYMPGIKAGSVLQAAAGVGLIADGLLKVNAPVPYRVSGSFSGSSNLFDDTIPKIILEYQPYVYDDTIKPNYGIADNTYAQFSTITGYMEAENVKLVSTQTAVRQEMLKQCLAEGCIL